MATLIRPAATQDTVELAPQHGLRSFFRLVGLLAPFKGRVILSVALAMLMMIPMMSQPLIVGKVVDLIAAENYDEIAPWIWLLIAAGIARAIIWFFRRFVAGTISLSLERSLRNRLYRHLMQLPESFHQENQTGQLMSRVTVDVSSVRFFLGYGLIYFIGNFLIISSVSVIIAIINWRVALAFYAMMPLIVYISNRFSRQMHGIYKDVQQRTAVVTAAAEENIIGHRVVRSFGQEEQEAERFRFLAQRVVEKEGDARAIAKRYTPLYDLIPSIALAAVVMLAAVAIDDGDLTIGAFFAFYGYLLMVVNPLRFVGNILNRAQRAAASGERIFALLERDDHLPVNDDAIELEQRTPGSVELSGVSFAYGEREILSDVTFSVDAGETVALLGKTGSGKSTVASLLARAFDPKTGSISIDGTELHGIELESVRRAVGIVGQEPYLFSATVADNIRFGRPEATDDDVKAAARIAQAEEFIVDLPDGYATIIGERGQTLSGGQRQRLAIARAIASEPKVLVLDDATASVDAESESLITDALHGATRLRTTILIAHRPSTIALADRIIILDGGRIVDEGVHDDLITRNELYQDLFMQGADDSTDAAGTADGPPANADDAADVDDGGPAS